MVTPAFVAELAAGLWATGAWLCLSFGATLIGVSAAGWWHYGRPGAKA